MFDQLRLWTMLVEGGLLSPQQLLQRAARLHGRLEPRPRTLGGDLVFVHDVIDSIHQAFDAFSQNGDRPAFVASVKARLSALGD